MESYANERNANYVEVMQISGWQNREKALYKKTHIHETAKPKSTSNKLKEKICFF